MSRRRTKDAASGGVTEVYPTPRWAIERLLEDPTLPRWPVGGRWLEPCAESGQIIRVVSDRVPGIAWTACEILPSFEDALHAVVCEASGPRTATTITGDFMRFAKQGLFDATKPHGERWAFDAIITNPPYSLAYDFVDACRLLSPLVVMLLPLNIFESSDRAERHHLLMPTAVRVLPDRPSFDGVSSDSRAYAWMVWDQHSGPECTSVRVLKTTPKDVRMAEKAEARERTRLRLGPEEYARRVKRTEAIMAAVKVDPSAST